jgi:hypothetical protein
MAVNFHYVSPENNKLLMLFLGQVVVTDDGGQIE